MLKLLETYESILLESQNEDQAEKILKKNIEDEDTANDLLQKIKEADHTEQNKYLPILARIEVQKRKEVENGELQQNAIDFIESSSPMDKIVRGLQFVEKEFNASLQFSKKEGFFFNKDVEPYKQKADEPFSNVLAVMAILGSAADDAKRRDKLKRARKGGKQDQEKAEVDGKPTTKVYEGKNIEIFAGRGKQACIEHSEGTGWCIGDPKGGHYEDYRSEGKSFYFVYDYTLEEDVPGSRVVVEVKKPDRDYEIDDEDEDDEEGEEPEVDIDNMSVHDKRNAEDDQVAVDFLDDEEGEGGEMDEDKYELLDRSDYLREYLDPKIDESIFSIFEPIPLEGEERISGYIDNLSKNKFEDVVGTTMELDDGTVVDLTLELVKRRGLDSTVYDAIKKDAVARKYLKEYVWTAIINFKIDMSDNEVFQMIDSKFFDKYAKKVKENYDGDVSAALRNLPKQYVSLGMSSEMVDTMLKEHLEQNNKTIIPDFLLNKVSDELFMKDIMRKIKNKMVPSSAISAIIDRGQGNTQLVTKIFDEIIKQVRSAPDDDEILVKDMIKDALMMLVNVHHQGNEEILDVDQVNNILSKFIDVLTEKTIFVDKLPYIIRDEFQPQAEVIDKYRKYADHLINDQKLFLKPGVIDNFFGMLNDFEVSKEYIMKYINEGNYYYRDLIAFFRNGIIGEDTFHEIIINAPPKFIELEDPSELNIKQEVIDKRVKNRMKDDEPVRMAFLRAASQDVIDEYIEHVVNSDNIEGHRKMLELVSSPESIIKNHIENKIEKNEEDVEDWIIISAPQELVDRYLKWKADNNKEASIVELKAASKEAQLYYNKKTESVKKGGLRSILRENLLNRA